MDKQNGRGKLESTGSHFVLNFVLREPVVSFYFCTSAFIVVGLGWGFKHKSRSENKKDCIKNFSDIFLVSGLCYYMFCFKYKLYTCVVCPYLCVRLSEGMKENERDGVSVELLD